MRFSKLNDHIGPTCDNIIYISIIKEIIKMTKNIIQFHLVDIEADEISEATDLNHAQDIFKFWLLLGKDPRAIKVFSDRGNITEDFFQITNEEFNYE